MILHNVNNNQAYRLNSGSSSPCSKPGQKFVQTSYALKSQFIGLILSLTVQSPIYPAPKATTYVAYVKRAARKAYFKMNRPFNVIKSHPYWCRQESRTVCPRNMQLMPTLASINVANQHWAGLVLGWVAACGRVNRLTSHLGQLSLPSLRGR